MKLPLSAQTLAQLRCPKSRQALHLADEDEIKRWQQLEPKTTQFLVTKDGEMAYPVDDGYPILLLDRVLMRPG